MKPAPADQPASLEPEQDGVGVVGRQELAAVGRCRHRHSGPVVELALASYPGFTLTAPPAVEADFTVGLETEQRRQRGLLLMWGSAAAALTCSGP